LDKLEIDVELAVRFKNNSQAIEAIDNFITKATDFINAALALAKKYRDGGNSENASLCLKGVATAEVAINNSLKLKESIV
jgi:hypothetical protein